ncbi:hypothetical protein J4Q44_G00023210 [Coregonus suidteri]|uniref:Uncharacterized protein n=1 Tax=Coregonus suidteri TaxID=861788 RepID=A0AAN8R698_9TELE
MLGVLPRGKMPKPHAGEECPGQQAGPGGRVLPLPRLPPQRGPRLCTLGRQHLPPGPV